MNPKIKELRDEFVDKVIEELDKGKIPWQKPWNIKMPLNAVTNRNYNGLNSIRLCFSKYSDHRWATYKQAMDNGWQVKKGEKATRIEIWKQYDKKTKKDADWVEINKLPDSEKKEYIEKHIQLVTRTYSIFNAEQIEGIPTLGKKEITIDYNKIDTILNNCGCKINYGGNKAFYAPLDDDITLPLKKNFISEEDFYGTALHEVSHSTGHSNRLNRDLSGGFKTAKYAKEELIAELSSVFIQMEKGIKYNSQNNIAYLQSWSEVLKKDKNIFFEAVKEAEKACEMVLSYEKEIKIETKKYIITEIGVDEFKIILKNHNLWLSTNGSQGKQADLSNRKLGKDFDSIKINLTNYNMSKSICKNTSFADKELYYVNFEGANIEEADFTNSTCYKSNFSSTSAKNANFTLARLDDVSFVHANLENANFYAAITSKANFIEANLNGTNMESSEKIPFEKRIELLQKRINEQFEVSKEILLNGEQKEYYENGALQREAMYKDGKLNGTEKIYYKSGNIQSINSWKENKITGITQDYYENGHLKNESQWLNSYREGISKRYYENGKIKHESNWQNFERNGLSKEYYENGQLNIKCNYKDDKLHGKYESFYPNGQRKIEFIYINGKLNGEQKLYYPNGQLYKEYICKEGKIEGAENTYYENEKFMQEMNYKNGKLEGISTQYYEDGNLKLNSIYKNNELEGNIKIFDQTVKEKKYDIKTDIESEMLKKSGTIFIAVPSDKFQCTNRVLSEIRKEYLTSDNVKDIGKNIEINKDYLQVYKLNEETKTYEFKQTKINEKKKEKSKEQGIEK
ncbi:MAG: ssDNA-binding domain-containing protein [Fusobacteriaceae bacterium]|jgi:antirestriction protein ArdC|nr:ssDNA-binding domain-containing protein [Fusobacteriaceae bacterium]